LYKLGDHTHYGQDLEQCWIQACWSQLLERGEYHKLEKEVLAAVGARWLMC
jgi:hypothetical protein